MLSLQHVMIVSSILHSYSFKYLVSDMIWSCGNLSLYDYLFGLIAVDAISVAYKNTTEVVFLLPI